MILRALIFILCLFVGTTTSHAQCDSLDLSGVDSLGNGYMIVYQEDNPESGCPPFGKYEEGCVQDNLKNGFWVRYHNDGITPKLRGYYKNNRPCGEYYRYYESGVLRESGSHIKGRYYGKLLRYHENGQLEYSGTYNESGKETDTTMYFFSSGCPEYVIIFKDNYVIEGVHYYKDSCEIVNPNAGNFEWKHDCKMLGEEEIKEIQKMSLDTINPMDDCGRKQGYWIYHGKDRPESGYPPDGKIEEGNYVDNRKEGLWIKYHIDGVTPKLRGMYKNNRPSGEYTKYNPDGSIKEEGTFDHKSIIQLIRGAHRVPPKQTQTNRDTRGWHTDLESNKYNCVYTKYYDSCEILWKRSYDWDSKEVDTSYYYYKSGCLEALEIYFNPDKLAIRINYSKEECNEIIDTIDYRKEGKSNPDENKQKDEEGSKVNYKEEEH